MLAKLWTDEKNRLTDVLANRVLNGRDRILYRELTAIEPIPLMFQLYARRKAERIFSEHRPVRFVTGQRYSGDGRQLAPHLQSLREACLQQTTLLADEIRACARAAVHLQFDLLVWPRQTVAGLLYAKQERASREDITVVLDGLGEDRGFVRSLRAHLERSDQAELNRESFEKMARRVESEIYAERPLSTFLMEVDHYRQFMHEITGAPATAVPARILLGMLWERELHDLAAGLKEEVLTRELWTPEEIEPLLERQLVMGGLQDVNGGDADEFSFEVEDRPRPEIGPDEALTATAVHQPEHIQSTPLKTSPPERPSGGLRFLLVEESEEEQKPAPEKRVKFSEDDTANRVIKRQDIESQPPGPYPPLASLISARTRKVFVKKIFKKDDDQYRSFIARLDKIDIWKDAKATIDAELVRRNISPYSREAVLLGDVVFSRYFSKK